MKSRRLKEQKAMGLIRELRRIDHELIRLLEARMETFAYLLKQEGRKALTRAKFFLEDSNNIPFSETFFSHLSVLLSTEMEKMAARDYKLVAFQGEPGAYSELAARRWNEEFLCYPCNDFQEIFQGIDNGDFDFGIIPIENNTGGLVNQSSRYFMNYQLFIAGAVESSIHHCLLVPDGLNFDDVKVVYSHPQALEQCSEFIKKNNLEARSYFDTAGAARFVAQSRPPATGAIASQEAAYLYGLKVLARNIENVSNNITRFLLIARKPLLEEGDKCSLLFSTEHRAGTLFQILRIFARRNINLTRIQSIPDQKGSFVFFLDFLGSQKDVNVLKALNEVEKKTTFFRFLGNYKELLIS